MWMTSPTLFAGNEPNAGYHTPSVHSMEPMHGVSCQNQKLYLSLGPVWRTYFSGTPTSQLEAFRAGMGSNMATIIRTTLFCQALLNHVCTINLTTFSKLLTWAYILMTSCITQGIFLAKIRKEVPQKLGRLLTGKRVQAAKPENLPRFHTSLV